MMRSLLSVLLPIYRRFPDRLQAVLTSLYLDRAVDGDVGVPVEFSLRNDDITVGEGAALGRHTSVEDLTLEPHATLGPDSNVRGQVTVGRGSNLGSGCDLRGAVSIGRYCAIADDVVFMARNHVTDRPSVQHELYSRVLDSELGSVTRGGITVEHDVWIGTRAILLPGVTVGSGAVVGANAVVTDDVAPYEVVGGVPAEHIDWRFPEAERERLLDLAWWDWSEERMRANADFFDSRVVDRESFPGE